MLVREREGKDFGVIAIAEGLAELLPAKNLEGITRDDHGHIAIADVSLGRTFAKLVSDAYEKQTGKKKKVNGLQLGYEARCAKPHAFDVMLGAQLGVGAYRALVEEGLNGVMVSVSGQLDLHYVDFEKLGKPRDAGYSRQVHRTGLRFPQACSVHGNLRQRIGGTMQAKEIKNGTVVNYNGAPILIQGISVQSPSARGAATLYKFKGSQSCYEAKARYHPEGTGVA